MKKRKINWIVLPWILMFPDVNLTYEQSMSQDMRASKARIEIEFFREHLKVMEKTQ